LTRNVCVEGQPVDTLPWDVEHRPPRFDDQLACWRITRYRDAIEVLRDPTLYQQQNMPGPLRELEWRPKEARLVPKADALIHLNPPWHAAVKRTVASAWQVSRRSHILAGQISRATETRVAAAPVDRAIRVHEELAEPVATIATAQFFGVSADAWLAHRARTRAETAQSSANEQQVAHALTRLTPESSTARLLDAIMCEVEARIDTADDSCISAMLRVVRQDTGQRLRVNEVVSLVQSADVIGVDSVSRLMTSALWFLLHMRRSREAITGSRVRAILEEAMRIEPPIVWLLTRISARRARLGGVMIPAGAPVSVDIVSANRDPATFGRANCFDPNRSNLRAHLSAGYGMHACLGIPLALTVSSVFLSTLISRRPNLRIASGRDRSTGEFGVWLGSPAAPVRSSEIAIEVAGD
jgi:cytochrome P450